MLVYCFGLATRQFGRHRIQRQVAQTAAHVEPTARSFES
jgi:hypothetical protein